MQIDYPQSTTIGEIARACMAQSEPGVEVHAVITVFDGKAVVDFYETTSNSRVPQWLRRQAL